MLILRHIRWSDVDHMFDAQQYKTNIQDAEQLRSVMMRIIGDLIILTPVIPTLNDSWLAQGWGEKYK